MDIKNAIEAKSESRQKVVRYRFCAYTFDIPGDHDLREIKYSGANYAVETNKAVFLLRPCHKCQQLLASINFYERKSPCKKCHMKLVKDWQKRNPEKVRVIKARNNKAYRYKRKLIEAGIKP